MDALQPAAPIHHFDLDARGIACGVRGVDHRSTKHPRQVTCPRCVEWLTGRADAPHEPAAAAP